MRTSSDKRTEAPLSSALTANLWDFMSFKMSTSNLSFNALHLECLVFFLMVCWRFLKVFFMLRLYIIIIKMFLIYDFSELHTLRLIWYLWTFDCVPNYTVLNTAGSRHRFYYCTWHQSLRHEEGNIFCHSYSFFFSCTIIFCHSGTIKNIIIHLSTLWIH